MGFGLIGLFLIQEFSVALRGVSGFLAISIKVKGTQLVVGRIDRGGPTVARQRSHKVAFVRLGDGKLRGLNFDFQVTDVLLGPSTFTRISPSLSSASHSASIREKV